MAAKEQADESLDALLEFLLESRGFDFTGYKRTTLGRRIGKRMAAVEAESYADYQEFLEVNPQEFAELFDTILINVTGFYRDPPAWEYLAQEIVPQVLQRADADSIRIWSAGCASGEEAYTLVMVFAEALGEEEFKRRVKVYATDVDDDALQTARHATYPEEALDPVPAGLREKYFEPNSTGFQFRPDLRRSVIYGRNDLVQDAPISRIDLLVSRNVLMYFTADAQTHIVSRFHFALNPGGFLFVGKSEMLLAHDQLFTPVDVKARVFEKVLVTPDALRDQLGRPGGLAAGGQTRIGRQDSAQLVAGAAALLPLAAIIVDADGNVADINHQASQLFGLGGAEIGRPFRDLDVSYRAADLRTALDEVYSGRKEVALGRHPWPDPGSSEILTLEIKVTPIPGDEDLVGVVITFANVTAMARLSDSYEQSRHELEAAYEELQSTVEELETTNEELQSTNEELETTNEELQSTNEELETMNEELQSTNDELETVNEDHSARALELDRVNMFLEGLLGNLGVGVAVIDAEQCVEVWNATAQELWGLAAGEVEGRQFLALDIGLPVALLADPLRQALAGRGTGETLVIDAVNRRGKSFQCAVRILPLRSHADEIHGAVIMMGDADSRDGEAAFAVEKKPRAKR